MYWRSTYGVVTKNACASRSGPSPAISTVARDEAEGVRAIWGPLDESWERVEAAWSEIRAAAEVAIADAALERAAGEI